MIAILFFNFAFTIFHQRLHYLGTENGNSLVLVMDKIVDIDFSVELCDYKINKFTPVGSFRKVGINFLSGDVRNKIKKDFEDTNNLTVFIIKNCTLSFQNKYAIRYFERESGYLFYSLFSFESGLSITFSHYIYDLLILSKIFYDGEKLINIQKSVYEVLQDMNQRNPHLDKVFNKLIRDIPKSERMLNFLDRLNVAYQNIENKNELLKKRNEIQANLRKKYDIERFLENHQDSIFKVIKTYQCMLRNNEVYSRLYEEYCLVKQINNK